MSSTRYRGDTDAPSVIFSDLGDGNTAAAGGNEAASALPSSSGAAAQDDDGSSAQLRPSEDQSGAPDSSQRGRGKGRSGRGRGRPPVEGAVYSKHYMALKARRAKRKEDMTTLEAEVTAKLQEVNLLAVEREALAAQAQVLNRAIAASEGALRDLGAGTGLRHHQSSDSDGRPSSAPASSGHESSAAADSMPCSSSSASSGPPGGGGGGAAAAGSSGSRGTAGTAPSEDTAFLEWVGQYKAHLQHARHERLRDDGTVAPLPLDDPRRVAFEELLAKCATLPLQLMTRLSTVNLDTMEPQERPPDFNEVVAIQMQFTDDQRQAMLAAFDSRVPALGALEEDGKRLRGLLCSANGFGSEELALIGMVARDEGDIRSALSRSGGGGGGGGVGMGAGASAGLSREREEKLVAQLWDNIKKTYTAWTLLDCSLAQLAGEENVVHMGLLAWPYIPDMLQVFSAYRKEVLRLDG